MAKRKQPEKRSWRVTVRCVVTKELVCNGCTEEEARGNPYDHCDDETELSQDDWTVTKIEPND